MTQRPSVEEPSVPSRDALRSASRRGRKVLSAKRMTMYVGVLLIVGLIVVAVGADYFAPHDYRAQKMSMRYASPSAEHRFGTDDLGRDVFSRVLLGTRTSLLISVSAVVSAMIIGLALGMWGGYRSGWVDDVVSRVIDILMSFPALLLGLMVATSLGAGTGNTIVAISIALVPRFARVARAATMSLRELPFVEASRAVGAVDWHIVMRHVLPNIMGEVIVMATLWMATAIRIEASLSFLGLGVQPPTPSWGSMLKDGVDRILFVPWLALYPGLAIMVASFSFNLLGDSARDYLDPRTRKEV